MAIKLRLVPRAALKAKVAPRLGASVAGGDGIIVSLASNVYTVSVDTTGLGMDQLQPVDADLTALANNTTPGVWIAGANVARTLTGTAN
jgi:hypothetical protein